jgi:chromosome partitioning protein
MPDPLAGMPPRFLRTPEAARFLGLSGRTLEKHRTYGTGPKSQDRRSRGLRARRPEGVGRPRGQDVDLRSRWRDRLSCQAPTGACGIPAASPLMFLIFHHGSRAPMSDRRTARQASSAPRCAVIVALLNQKGGVGKTTLAPHLAGQWVAKGKRVVVDADPQDSALDWSRQRAKEALPQLFSVLAFARDTLHRAAPKIARNADHVVIDGPPRLTPMMRSALLAADLVIIPALPSPFDGWASGEILRLVREAHIFRPQLLARFVLNRCSVRSVIAREAAEALVVAYPGGSGRPACRFRLCRTHRPTRLRGAPRRGSYRRNHCPCR